MDSAINVIQLLLALLFAISGLAKLSVPYAKFVTLPAQGWASDFEPKIVRLIGVLEVSAAAGILAAVLLPDLKLLTPLAGVGIALLMAGAVVTHLRRAEYPNVVGNLMWLGLALFVAYGKLVQILL